MLHFLHCAFRLVCRHDSESERKCAVHRKHMQLSLHRAKQGFKAYIKKRVSLPVVPNCRYNSTVATLIALDTRYTDTTSPYILLHRTNFFQIRYKSRIFYSPTDAQLNRLKINFKIYIKIDTKTAPTCFGVITIIRERTIRSCWSYIRSHTTELTTLMYFDWLF
jgi:hypothetical protein